MLQCKLCNKDTGGHTRVYCNKHCKDVFREIKLNVRRQTMAYRKEMNLGCTRCKKLLKDYEGVYCDSCVDYMDKLKEERKDTIHIRPCEECGVDMINPAGNRKWCELCSKDNKRKAIIKRTAEVKIRTAKVKSLSSKEIKIDPKWLTRGKI